MKNYILLIAVLLISCSDTRTKKTKVDTFKIDKYRFKVVRIDKIHKERLDTVLSYLDTICLNCDKGSNIAVMTNGKVGIEVGNGIYIDPSTGGMGFGF